MGSNYDFYFKPAVKSNLSLSSGRPKGGLFMAWKKNQVRKATRITSDNFRLQAAILEYENCKLLLINTYFANPGLQSLGLDLAKVAVCFLEHPTKREQRSTKTKSQEINII